MPHDSANDRRQDPRGAAAAPVPETEKKARLTHLSNRSDFRRQSTRLRFVAAGLERPKYLAPTIMVQLAARGAFESNIERQISSIPDYAAGKGTTFFFLPTAISPFCGRKFSSHEFNGALNYLPTGIQGKFVFDVFAVGLVRFHPQPQRV